MFHINKEENVMNKVIAVKSFALDRVGDIKANPQKYFALIAQAKKYTDAMYVLGNGLVKLIAHDKLSNA